MVPYGSLKTSMPTFELPSATICLPSALPSTVLGGASRKYHFEAPERESAVLAGENITVFEAETVGSTFSVTLEDSAPRIAETRDWSSFLTFVEPTVALFASEESVEIVQAFWPFTPPAALMSWMARPPPLIAAGPRNARFPVSGRKVPSLNCLAGSEPDGQSVGAVTVLEADAEVDADAEADVDAEADELDPADGVEQAAREVARAAPTAKAVTVRPRRCAGIAILRLSWMRRRGRTRTEL